MALTKNLSKSDSICKKKIIVTVYIEPFYTQLLVNIMSLRVFLAIWWFDSKLGLDVMVIYARWSGWFGRTFLYACFHAWVMALFPTENGPLIPGKEKEKKEGFFSFLSSFHTWEKMELLYLTVEWVVNVKVKKRVVHLKRKTFWQQQQQQLEEKWRGNVGLEKDP